MKDITLQDAQGIVNTLNSRQALHTSRINVASIINALAGVAATTFATLTQASKVTCDKFNKHRNVYKITVQNVTLCNSDSGLYTNAVTREVIATGQAADFTALPSNYVMVDGSYSVCALKSDTSKHYLRATVNKCISVVYYCADSHAILSKEQVAGYLSPGAARKLLEASKPNVVQHAGVEHNVTIRNFGLGNIYSINVAQQQLVC